MKKEKMTIEDLARITKNGFDTTATKQEMREVNDRLDKMDGRLDKMDSRLDKMENLLLRAHENRIEKLEDNMRLVKTKIGIR